MQHFFGVVIRRMDFLAILQRNTSAACGFQTRPCFRQGWCADATVSQRAVRGAPRGRQL